MKKIYRKPNLAIESFVTEEVMSKTNALESSTYTDSGQTWDFIAVGDGNMLNSVDYSDF